MINNSMTPINPAAPVCCVYVTSPICMLKNFLFYGGCNKTMLVFIRRIKLFFYWRRSPFYIDSYFPKIR